MTTLALVVAVAALTGVIVLASGYSALLRIIDEPQRAISSGGGVVRGPVPAFADGRASLLPQNRRLVPQIVMRHPVTGPLQFGFEMGTGVRTYSPSALPLCTAVLVALWSGSLAYAVLAGVGFAIGRGPVHPFRRSDPHRWDDALRAGARWFSGLPDGRAVYATLVLVLLYGWCHTSLLLDVQRT